MKRAYLAKRFFLLCLFLLGGNSIAFAEETKLELHYDITRHGFTVAKNTQKITIKGDQYWMESVTESAGWAGWFSDRIITESSYGKIIGGRYQPQFYNHIKVEDDEVFNTAVQFSDDGKTITNISSGKTWSTSSEHHLIDRLTLILVLAKFAKGEIDVPVQWIADGGYPKAIQLVKQATDKDGTVKIESSANKKAPATWWLAPSNYLPVKTKITRGDGKTYVMKIDD